MSGSGTTSLTSGAGSGAERGSGGAAGRPNPGANRRFAAPPIDVLSPSGASAPHLVLSGGTGASVNMAHSTSDHNDAPGHGPGAGPGPARASSAIRTASDPAALALYLSGAGPSSSSSDAA